MFRFILILLFAFASFAANFAEPNNITEKYKIDISWQQERLVSFSKKILHVYTDKKQYIIQTLDKQLKVFTLEGELLFEKKFNSAIQSSVIANNKIAIVTSLGKLCVLDINTKSLEWEKQLSRAVTSPLVVEQNILIVQTVDEALHTFSIMTGKSLWQYSHKNFKPALKWHLSKADTISTTSSLVLVGYTSGDFECLALSDGRVLWHNEFVYAPTTGANEIHGIAAKPILSDHKVLTANYHSSVKAFDLLTGQQIWSNSASPTNKNMVCEENILSVLTANGQLLGIDTDTGVTLWKQTKFYGKITASPTVVGGNFILADDLAYIYVVAPETGEILFKHKFGTTAITELLALNNRNILVLNEHGELAEISLQEQEVK